MTRPEPVNGSFVPYLPQDNVENEQSERVVCLITTALEELLGASAAEFWRRIKSDASVVECIGSYLQFCRRPGDHSIEAVSPPSAARKFLAKNVFLLIFRLVTREPGSSLSTSEQGQLLYDRRMLDVPKLFDVAALYAEHNSCLCRQLMQQVFALQPRCTEDLGSAVPLIASNVTDVQRTCQNAVKRLEVSHNSASFQGLTDGLAYLWDSCFTLAGFCRAWPPAAALFITAGGSLVAVISGVYAHLLPGATKIWAQSRDRPAEKNTAVLMQGYILGLEVGIQQLLYALIDGLCTPVSVRRTSQEPLTSSRPQAEPDAEGRGRMLLEALRPAAQASNLLKIAQQRFNIVQSLSNAVKQGHILLDDSHLDSAFALLGSPETSSAVRDAGRAAATAAKAAEREAQLKQIHEVLPGYGDGFLAACLDAAGQDVERVVHQLLEGSLPEELSRLNIQMPLERLQTDSAPGPSTRNTPGNFGTKATADGKPSALSAAVHKGTAYALQSTPQDKALAKLHAHAAQWEDEYDDEYDDSFDDLAAFEADGNAEPQGDRVEASSSTSAQGKPKGGKALWVLNGRVYNYRKEGATPAPDQTAAQEMVQTQQAAAQAIGGLGPGGNRPAAAHTGGDGLAEPSKAQDSGWRGRGRGVRTQPPDARRERAFKNEHKGAVANHNRKDRALRKTGGPAG